MRNSPFVYGGGGYDSRFPFFCRFIRSSSFLKNPFAFFPAFRVLFTRLVVLIGCFYMVTLPALATCLNGIEISGKNGHVYCQSLHLMNWEAACSWCLMQERAMATMEQLCNMDETRAWDGQGGYEKCFNWIGIGENWIWSASLSGETDAYLITLPYGNVFKADRVHNEFYAVCW